MLVLMKPLAGWPWWVGFGGAPVVALAVAKFEFGRDDTDETAQFLTAAATRGLVWQQTQEPLVCRRQQA